MQITTIDESSPLPPTGINLTIIEEHNADGVTWGLSTAGPNPPAEEFLQVASHAEAVRIKDAADAGDIMPYLEAAKAVVETIEEFDPILSGERLAEIKRRVEVGTAKEDWEYHRSEDKAFLEYWRRDTPDLLAHIDALQETINVIEREVSEVYCHITSNRLSKPNTSAMYLIAEFDRAMNEAYDEGKADAMQPMEPDMSYVTHASQEAADLPKVLGSAQSLAKSEVTNGE